MRKADAVTTLSCKKAAEELLERCLRREPWPTSLLHDLVEGDCSEELFGIVIEGLSNRFDPELCDEYSRLFSQVLAWASPGLNARALMERYDLGYASAAMHAAAACGTPLLAVFTGFPTERTFHRWHPVGQGPIEVLKVTDHAPGLALERTLQALDRLLPCGKPAFLTNRAASTERVAVVRALPGWGDMLCSVPALRALRRALPHANITLVGLPWAAAFVKRFSRYIDDLLEFPGFPGFPVPEEPEAGAILAFLAAAHGRRFDIALQMHGSGITSNPFTEMLGARCTAGCYVQGNYCPDPERFLPYPAAEHEIRRGLRLLEFLGAPSQGEDLEFPLIREDWAELSSMGAASGLHDREYVCIHPGASLPARRWIPERFARVADALSQKGLPVVLTGAASERDLAREVGAQMRMPFRDLTGPMSFGALGALISRARLLICNDTGVSHLASALRVPSVVVFTAADPERWAPLDHALHRAVHVPVGCRPCEYRVCPIGHPCSEGVTASAVLAQAESLLRKEQVYAA